MFANMGWPPKLANIPPCYVFLIQIIYGNCIFGHSLAKLANMVQGKTVGKHTPLKSGGLGHSPVFATAKVSNIYTFRTLTIFMFRNSPNRACSLGLSRILKDTGATAACFTPDYCPI